MTLWPASSRPANGSGNGSKNSPRSRSEGPFRWNARQWCPACLPPVRLARRPHGWPDGCRRSAAVLGHVQRELPKSACELGIERVPAVLMRQSDAPCSVRSKGALPPPSCFRPDARDREANNNGAGSSRTTAGMPPRTGRIASHQGCGCRSSSVIVHDRTVPSWSGLRRG